MSAGVASASSPRRSRRSAPHAARRAVRTGSLWIAALAVLATVPLLGADCTGRASGIDPQGWVEIRGRRIAVEIAEDPQTQARGLGGRDTLAWDHGMYFVYDTPGFYTYWMKGMRFPIDIVWIRSGRIVDLDPHVPFDPSGNGPTIRPSSLVDAVLEVPAGSAIAYGWRVGDRVTFERTRAAESAATPAAAAP